MANTGKWSLPPCGDTKGMSALPFLEWRPKAVSVEAVKAADGNMGVSLLPECKAITALALTGMECPSEPRVRRLCPWIESS